MARTRHHGIEQIILILIAIGCFIAAFLSYPDRHAPDSNVYGTTILGWAQLAIWIMIGIFMRLTYLGYRSWKKDEKDPKYDSRGKT